MDANAVASLVIGAGTVIASALVALVVGRRRGLDQVEQRADSEVQRTMEAQARRLELQDREIAELKAQVASLQAQVLTLKTDLDVERRISLRFRTDTAADGR